MSVVDVRRVASEDGVPNRHVVVLREVSGEREQLIWIGPFEAAALAVHLEKVETTRPLTYAFTAKLLGAAGARLREVRISRLVETTYFATAVLEGPAGSHAIDARPSDALNLALEMGAPIFVEPAVLAAAASHQPPDCLPSDQLDARLGDAMGAAEILAPLKEQWCLEARLREQWRHDQSTPRSEP